MDSPKSLEQLTLDERILSFLEHLEKPQKNANSLLRSRVSNLERVEQLALDLAQKNNFHQGFQELLKALEISRHPKTQKALRELIQANITPFELSLVLELRATWREYPEFSAVVGNFFSSGSARREHLSYRLALRLIRHFTYFPTTDDVVLLIQNLLTIWRDHVSLLHRFKVFQDFLSFATEDSDVLDFDITHFDDRSYQYD